jgi:hypothetical protein
MWKDAAGTYFLIIFRHFLGRGWGKPQKPRPDNRTPCWEFSPEPSEYEAEFHGAGIFLKTLQLFSWPRNPLLLWNLKTNYSIHKSPPLDPTLGLSNKVRIFTPDFSKIHLINILPLITSIRSHDACVQISALPTQIPSTLPLQWP